MYHAPCNLSGILSQLSRRSCPWRVEQTGGSIPSSALGVERSDVRDQKHCARLITAQIATVMEATRLVRHSGPATADAFVASRLEGLLDRAFGSLPRDCDLASIVARSRPS